MKKITQEQIKKIMEELVKQNIQVQSFIMIEKLLTSLPEVEKKDEK